MERTRKRFVALRQLIANHMHRHKSDPDYHYEMFVYIDCIMDTLLFTDQLELHEMLKPYWYHFLRERFKKLS